jgi:hypothetical protein
MTEISTHDFLREMICNYDHERYSVRDNGAVLRHPRPGRNPRPTDNNWTFGKPNSQNGYMYIAQVRIHRIVATAFHGEPPTPEHVVDHIDTNRRNNRPENLRWLTRLENALLNPITVKRIEFVCGSIEAFLEDPSKLRHSSFDRSFDWMRTVSPQEAHACRERMQLWAKSYKPTSGGGSLGEWVFKPVVFSNPTLKAPREAPRLARTITPAREKTFSPIPPEPELVMAKTAGAAQRNWRTPTEFPCCPQDATDNPISRYAEKLKAGEKFARNDFSTSVVLEISIADEGQSIWVICENAQTGAIKPWSLAKVTHEEDLFVHASHGTYFEKEGAEKQFCLARGLEWTGGDTFDDFC